MVNVAGGGPTTVGRPSTVMVCPMEAVSREPGTTYPGLAVGRPSMIVGISMEPVGEGVYIGTGGGVISGRSGSLALFAEDGFGGIDGVMTPGRVGCADMNVEVSSKPVSVGCGGGISMDLSGLLCCSNPSVEVSTWIGRLLTDEVNEVVSQTNFGAYTSAPPGRFPWTEEQDMKAGSVGKALLNHELSGFSCAAIRIGVYSAPT